MGSWKYEVIHDYNGTKLIEEFREENLKLKNSKGTDDDAIDFMVYAEKDDHTISLGRVLLIKMSDAMIKYYYQYKGKEDLIRFWAKYVYEQQSSNSTFHFTEEAIAEAFLESIKLQTNLVFDITALEAENYLKKITESLSEFLHEGLKFTREQWDPTLQSDEYLLAKPERAAYYFVNKSNALISQLNDLKAKLKLVESFNIVGFEFKTPFIGDLITAIDNKIKSIQKFKMWIIQNIDELELKLPYLCGIWNGLVEFVAGIADVVLLAFNILFSEILKEESNLEIVQLRESIEEILAAMLRDPLKVVDEAINAIKSYKYSRYNAPQLNPYQLQYNEGEDTILAIDVIITIVTIVKGLAELSKSLPKFTQWIEEVLAKNGKGALKAEEALQEARRTKKLIGAVEYEILSENLLKKYVDDVVRICEAKGIKLEIKWIDEAHPEFYNRELLGKFEVTLNKRKLFLHLRPECPKITWFHERKHLEDFLEMGWRRYTDISKKTPWKHEESVWNYLYKNRNKWSEAELVDAYEYVKKYFKDRFQKFPQIKELDELGKNLGLTK